MDVRELVIKILVLIVLIAMFEVVIEMSESLITKRALANALKELMAEYPLNKITVGDIVECCNMNRKSFYYHFKDKYDLVNWIYYTEFVANFKEELIDSEWDFIEDICEFFYKNKAFYRNALQITGQNSFYEYFGEVLSPFILIYFESIFEESKNREFYVTFFTDAFRTSISRWLLEGAKIHPKEFVGLIKSAVTGAAVKIVKELEQNIL